MMAHQKTVGLITARGGSKSIPRKNVVPVGGKPLIAWTIEAALKSTLLSKTIVSTDDEEIASVCQRWGIEVSFIRPPELSQDESSHISVVLHALKWLEINEEGNPPDYLMLLQPTSPFRTEFDIDNAINLAIEKKAKTVVSVSETHHHPFLTKRISENGTLTDFISDSPAQGSAEIRRQVLPKAYFVNGAIFLNRCDVLQTERNLIPLCSVPYIMPPERSLQIDELWDLEMSRLIFKDA